MISERFTLRSSAYCKGQQTVFIYLQFSVRYNWRMVISGLVDFRRRRRRKRMEMKAGGKMLYNVWCHTSVVCRSCPNSRCFTNILSWCPHCSLQWRQKEKACHCSYAKSSLHLHNYHILVRVALSIMSFCLASRSNFTRSYD